MPCKNKPVYDNLSILNAYSFRMPGMDKADFREGKIGIKYTP
jgi:hypothetical protein